MFLLLVLFPLERCVPDRQQIIPDFTSVLTVFDSLHLTSKKPDSLCYPLIMTEHNGKGCCLLSHTFYYPDLHWGCPEPCQYSLHACANAK